MSISEILSVLWHRKLIVVAVLAVAIGAAVAALQVISPEYRATSTLSVAPVKAGATDIVFFNVINQIMSIYATAAETDTTLDAAKARNGGELASVSVRTFDGAPIMKIDARGTDRALARRSAQAVTAVLLERVQAGQVGVPGYQLKEIDQPSLPSSPVYPDTKLTYAVAALIGLGLGIGAAFLWETLGRRVRSRGDLADAAGVPVYAEIALVPPVRRVHNLASFATDPDLRTVAEALRDLRTNLVFTDDTPGSIVVTSPEGRHGKTTVAAGLAATMARSGVRAILVDADLHRGRVADMLRVPHVPGLREALEGRELPTLIRATTVENVDLLTSGRTGGDPGELLATGFQPVVEWLEREYDVVVVDAPPLAPINDARLIARLAKTTLLVCASGKASHRSVRDAVERLKLIGVTPTAAVLNMSRSRQARGYYGPPARSTTANGATLATDLVEPEPRAGSRRTPTP